MTFTSPGAAAVASQLQLANFRGCRAVRGVAPVKGDMEWRNVGNAASAVEHRLLVGDAALLWVAVMWTPLIALLQSLANIEDLADTTRDGKYVFPWLRPFARKDRYETQRYLIAGYLPVLLVLVLLVVVPIGIEELGVRYVGLKTKSETQAYVSSPARGSFSEGTPRRRGSSFDDSRRRRGGDVDISRGRGGAAAATWILPAETGSRRRDVPRRHALRLTGPPAPLLLPAPDALRDGLERVRARHREPDRAGPIVRAPVPRRQLAEPRPLLPPDAHLQELRRFPRAEKILRGAC